MVKCSHQYGGHDIPSAVRLPDHRWRHDLSLGLEVQGRLSANPSAATRHRACHDVGPVTPIRGVARGQGPSQFLGSATPRRRADSTTAPRYLPSQKLGPKLGVKGGRSAALKEATSARSAAMI